MPTWLTPVLAWLKTAALASVGYIVAEGAAYLHLATIGLVISTAVFGALLIVIALKFGAVFAVIAAVVLFFLWGLITSHTAVASAAALPKLVAEPPVTLANLNSALSAHAFTASVTQPGWYRPPAQAEALDKSAGKMAWPTTWGSLNAVDCNNGGDVARD